jgi:hypothetical protein
MRQEKAMIQESVDNLIIYGNNVLSFFTPFAELANYSYIGFVSLPKYSPESIVLALREIKGLCMLDVEFV